MNSFVCVFLLVVRASVPREKRKKNKPKTMRTGKKTLEMNIRVHICICIFKNKKESNIKKWQTLEEHFVKFDSSDRKYT